jgi:hypothetical protein
MEGPTNQSQSKREHKSNQGFVRRLFAPIWLRLKPFHGKALKRGFLVFPKSRRKYVFPGSETDHESEVKIFVIPYADTQN